MGKAIAPLVRHAASSMMPFVPPVVSQQPYLSCLVKIVPSIVVIATRPNAPHAPLVSTAAAAAVVVAATAVITANATTAGKII
jgi:hypothetical protein